MQNKELVMSYRTILSLAAATVLSAACISTISTDAFEGITEPLPTVEFIAELTPTVEFIAERRWALAQLQ